MSQINDALRKAGSSARPGPGQPLPPPMPVSAPPSTASLPLPPVLPNFSPVEDGESAPRKSTGFQIGLAVTLVVCVSLAAVVTFWEKRNRASVSSKPTAEAGAKKTLPEDVLRKSVAARQPPAPAPTNVSPASATPTAAPAAAPAAAPTVAAAPVLPPRPVEPVKFPPLRLQSIFFRPSNPSVMINNKTLFVDDNIQGVQVADIQPSSVTLVLSGQTNILTLR